jgi:hypothetical protein
MTTTTVPSTTETPATGGRRVTGQHILIGLLAAAVAAAGQAAVLAEDVPADHGLVIAEHDLHWSPVKFGEITARL